jgi:S-formylglutathione hydrolase FrmB
MLLFQRNGKLIDPTFWGSMHRPSDWLAFSCVNIVRCLSVLCGFIAFPAMVWASTLVETTVPSAALGRALPVAIYRPDGAAPPSGWPVLYLLHGLNGSYRDWPTLGGIQSTLDLLIASRSVQPLVVVMPDAGNSWYVDSGAIGGPGNFETAILDDLPRAIEQDLPVRRDRSGRAIAGLSMGGFGALRLAFKRPDRYCAVASLSGAIWQNMPSDSLGDATIHETGGDYFRRVDSATIVSGIDRPPGNGHFGGVFGKPFDAQRFNAANVFTLLAQQLRAGAQLPAIYLTVGDHDSHDLWRGSIALYETLMVDGVSVDFRVTGGDHVWSLWRRSIEDALRFTDSKFIDAGIDRKIASRPAEFAGAAAALK